MKVAADSSESGKRLLRRLEEPGRILAFVDDSGTSGKPIPKLARDYNLLAAVLVQSEAYAACKLQLSSALASLGAADLELHSTEIVNPNRKCRWRGLPIAVRLDALRAGFSVLETHLLRGCYVYVSGEQFESTIRPQLASHGVPFKTHKEVLEHVFYNRLFSLLRQEGASFAIVADSRVPLTNALQIEAARDPRAILGGGVISVDSRVECGVQLADLLAFSLNRLHHARHRGGARAQTPFDELIVAELGSIYNRLADLLDAQSS